MTTAARPPGPTRAFERRKNFQQRYKEMRLGPMLGPTQSCFDAFGDLDYLRQWGAPTYVLRHPDHLHQVLVEQSSKFHKQAKRIGWFLGQGLLTSNGELWRRQRRLINPAFSRPKMESYLRVMGELTDRLVADYQPGQVRDLSRDMMALTLSVVCRALLDHDTAGQTDAIAEAITILQDTTGLFDPFPRWAPTALHRKQQGAVDQLDRIIFQMIEAKAPDSAAEDLISQLKAATDEQGQMSRRQLRDELVTLFLAGHETTAVTLAWTFYLLSQHPEHETRVHQELDRVLADRSPSLDDLERLEHCSRVITETMRLYPPLYLLPRVAVEDAELGGFTIPAGSELLLWVYFAHHDPRWFPEPERFDPDRWAPDSGRVLHPHAYLPFGAGTRVCLGKSFALAESTLILARIGQRYRLKLAPEQAVRPNPRVTLGPLEPIRMEIHPR